MTNISPFTLDKTKYVWRFFKVSQLATISKKLFVILSH